MPLDSSSQRKFRSHVGVVGHSLQVFSRLHLVQGSHDVHQEGAAERSVKDAAGERTAWGVLQAERDADAGYAATSKRTLRVDKDHPRGFTVYKESKALCLWYANTDATY